MDIDVSPFRCTKVMSKLIRTYTNSHGLKDLHKELLGFELVKEQQQTNWATKSLTMKQMEYASNDVLRLLEIHDHRTSRWLSDWTLISSTVV